MIVPWAGGPGVQDRGPDRRMTGALTDGGPGVQDRGPDRRMTGALTGPPPLQTLDPSHNVVPRTSVRSSQKGTKSTREEVKKARSDDGIALHPTFLATVLLQSSHAQPLAQVMVMRVMMMAVVMVMMMVVDASGNTPSSLSTATGSRGITGATATAAASAPPCASS
eukprot:1157957-Pelagomonas_calceolata.AAC.1